MSRLPIALAALALALVTQPGCQTTKSSAATPVATTTVASHDAPSARSLQTTLWTGQGMLIWGGMILLRLYRNDLW